DAYIDFAAKAKGEHNQKLEKMRQELLATAPKELTERPQPKNTATVVLPPRNPAAETKVMAPTAQVELQPVEREVAAIVEAPTPTCEEKKAAAPAQEKPVQSKSPLVFGNLAHIEQARKRPSKAKTPQEGKSAKPQSEVKAAAPAQEKPV